MEGKRRGWREEKGEGTQRRRMEEEGSREGRRRERRCVLDLPLKYMVTLGEGHGKFSWLKVGGMFQSK